MQQLRFLRRLRLCALILASAFVISSCGGGTSSGTEPATGTVLLLLTDAPVDELSAIYLDVTEATLIGGNGQQTIFSGNKTIVPVSGFTTALGRETLASSAPLMVGAC